MGWSVLETLDRVRKHLPSSLSAGALDRCARVAERLPNVMSSHYLEFRLNSGPEIDFLTFTRAKSVAARLDERLGPGRSPNWAENIAVLQEWAGSGTELSAAPFVYLEYDGGDPFNEAEPEASLSIGLEHDYRSRQWEGLRGGDARAVALGRVAFRRLLPEARREAYMAVLERCYAALPPLGAIPHAPVMAARERLTAKPYVVLPRESVFEFLSDIGWPGSGGALEDLLRTFYAAFPRTICIDLTVTDHVEERIGVVTSQFQQLETDFSSLAWWGLPNELTAFKDELRSWVGFSEERLGGERVWIHRWLDTKAVLNGGKIEYKAYLGFSPTRPPLFC